MIDMPETIWAAMHPHGSMECINYPVSYTTEYRRADLPPSREQVEAMVKPLEWTNIGRCDGWTPGDESTHLHVAMSLGRPCELKKYKDGWRAEWEFEYQVKALPSADAAKAAAQADHTRRILAALGYEEEA